MDRDSIKSIIRISHNFKGKPVLLRKLDEYLTKRFEEKIKKMQLDIPFFNLYVSELEGTAHYVNNRINLHIYKNEEFKNLDNCSNGYIANVQEHFSNCGMVCINNITSNSTRDDNKQIMEIILELAEDVTELFGYSNIVYTASKSQNQDLIPILNKTYKIINEFRNKRMSSDIIIYSKTL